MSARRQATKSYWSNETPTLVGTGSDENLGLGVDGSVKVRKLGRVVLGDGSTKTRSTSGVPKMESAVCGSNRQLRGARLGREHMSKCPK